MYCTYVCLYIIREVIGIIGIIWIIETILLLSEIASLGRILIVYQLYYKNAYHVIIQCCK